MDKSYLLMGALFIPVIIAFISIFIEPKNSKLSKNMFISSLIFSIPFLLVEYFIFYWFWGGDGTFNQVTVPIVWLILLFLQLFLIKIFTDIKFIKKILFFSVIFLSPILTCLVVYAIAYILGVVIEIA